MSTSRERGQRMAHAVPAPQSRQGRAAPAAPPAPAQRMGAQCRDSLLGSHTFTQSTFSHRHSRWLRGTNTEDDRHL